jgi:hypothetical protein
MVELHACKSLVQHPIWSHPIQGLSRPAPPALDRLARCHSSLHSNKNTENEVIMPAWWLTVTHIDHHDGSPPTVLVRESYCEGGKVKNRTLANLSS